jgi:galactonate dehydratase
MVEFELQDRGQLEANPIEDIVAYGYPPRFVFVEVHTKFGKAIGDATLEGQPHAVLGAIEDAKRFFIGQDANAVTIAPDYFTTQFYSNGPVTRSAIGGIDTALWDLWSRRLGVPLYQVFGGAHHRKGLPYYCWEGGHSPKPGFDEDSAATLVKRLVDERGVRSVKMNVSSFLPPIDVWQRIPIAGQVAADVRQAVGDDINLCFDFHGRGKPATARALLEALRPHRPFFIEEPMEEEHDDDLPSLREQAKEVYVATGERMYTLGAVRKLIKARAVDLIQTDLVHCGGPSILRKINALAEAAGIGVAPHCPLSVIAFMACYHTMVTSSAGCLLECADGIHYNTEFDDGYSGNPWTRPVSNPDVFNLGSDGLMPLPTGPGLGLTFDEEQLEAGKKIGAVWQRPTGRLETGAVCRW